MIKKVLTYSVVIATVVWSVGLLATPLAVGAAVSGDLIKLQCATGAEVNDPCKAVYYLGADGKRYVFPNEKTYSTWYSDFSGVQIVSDTEMSSYTIGGNATYRPGVKLVKITTDPKVYAVADNGTLMWVTTGALAESIYGADWATMVEDVPDAFFVNYTVGSDINDAADYDKDNETTDATSINVDKGLSADGDGGTVSTGTSLTVALAADTPASGLILENSINNKFTKVNLTASADGDIIIDQLVVRRGSMVASDVTFASIALIDAGTDVRIGNTKTLNSLHQAVFNKNITIAAGTTKSIYLAGNMNDLSAYAGEIPSLDLESITLAGSAAVIGTLPIVGNYQTLNGSVQIGTLTLNAGSNDPSASTQRIGSTNYIVSSVKLANNNQEDFKLHQISFKQGGTADNDDVVNLDLFVDDVLTATVENPTDGRVTYDLSANPILIAKGKTVNFDLQLDIADGSARTIRFDIDDESDVRALGQTYGAERKVAAGTATNGPTADATPFWTARITTVDTGALRVSSATLSNANVPEDADQVVLGKFEFDANGEAIEITSLPIHFLITTSSGILSSSPVDLTNVTVYDENGLIVAGPDDPTFKHYGAQGSKQINYGVTTTDTIIVPNGEHIYTIKADLNTDFGANDTIIAHIKPDQITARGETTGLAITASPLLSEQTSATFTVKTAALSMSISPVPSATTVVAGTDNYTFANIVLGAESSGEDVKVTKIAVRVECNNLCAAAEISNFEIWDGSTELDVTNTPDTSGSATNGDDATATFLLSTPLVITKGTSKTLTIKADIDNNATDGVVSVGMQDATTIANAGGHITAKGNDTNVAATVTLSGYDGNAMTLTSGGSLLITAHADDPADDYFISHSTEGLTAAVLTAKAKYEDVNIEKIWVTGGQINGGDFDQITNLHLYIDDVLKKTVTPTSSDGNTDSATLFDMTYDPIVVSPGNNVKITFKIDTPELDYDLNGLADRKPESFQGIAISINATGDVIAKGAQSGRDINATITAASGQNLYLVRSYPTITLDTTDDTFIGGTNTGKVLYEFTVTANSSGDIGLGKVSFKLTTSTATVTNLYLYQSSTKLATASTTILTTQTSAGTGGSEVHDFWITTNGALPNYIATNSNVNNLMHAKSVIPAGTSVIFRLKGDIECSVLNCNAGTNPTGGSVQVQLLSDGAKVGTAAIGLAGRISSKEGSTMEDSMLWTDFWRTPDLKTSSTTATSAEQWLNGYLVTDSTTDRNILEATTSAITLSR